mmetsp:Transcript_7251/g.10386  ORF Transcript_7251/g.10386 Transcript_7251/m.10386 type:complete len:203 (+) Transcript_7251:62-670(+)|eukprot:CAMPEP_0184857788 /NCGR_PEP_ID=MMETSP0580-20130426/2932_1 /TAXON_ID=1118495 /ORGANISM="Dactyliosolen fragilissimus" /LENGTH=202 /DNA_ID=CAMNT_0027353581 /DNA_START=45 /DNA_END=653 /DNA_ORIENTATION=-
MVAKSTLLFLAFTSAAASAFCPIQSNVRMETSTKLSRNENWVGASAVAAAVIASNVLTVGAAFAEDTPSTVHPDFGSSSNVIAARSGGRSGGRVSSTARSASRPSAAPSRSSSNTVYRSTTVYQPAPVISSPIVVSPFGYNPFFPSPFGVAAGIGNEIRDIRQEGEIQRERSELEIAKQKQYELEARLRQLEANQAAQVPSK